MRMINRKREKKIDNNKYIVTILQYFITRFNRLDFMMYM